MSENSSKIGKYQFVAEPFHVDFTGRLTMGVLGNHLLNCAGFHASDRGFGIATLFDKASSLPEMQNRYGVSDGVDSWGERKDLPKYDNLNDFFSTGVTSITSVSVSHGNEKLQNYFSYANTTGKGIIDKNRLSKHNITFRETSVIFNNRLKLDGNVNLMRQVSKNKPTVGGFYMNPLVGLYRFPRGEDLSYYRNNFEVYDESRNLNIQNWHGCFCYCSGRLPSVGFGERPTET